MSETQRNQVRPGEICEACAEQPAVQIMFRSGNLMSDPKGRVVAEIETRLVVCQSCWTEIISGRRRVPPGKVIARPNPETGKMEPI